jgi:hypothetical protein
VTGKEICGVIACLGRSMFAFEKLIGVMLMNQKERIIGQ